MLNANCALPTECALHISDTLFELVEILQRKNLLIWLSLLCKTDP